MAPAAPNPSATPTPSAPSRDVSRLRLAASVLLIVAGALAFVSSRLAWWTWTGGGVTTTFWPGSSFYTSTVGSRWVGYAAHGLGPVGGVYEAVFALLVVGGILAVVAGIVGAAFSLGRVRSTAGGTIGGVAIAGTVLLVAAAVLAPLLQPWAYRRATGSGGCSFGGTTPCSAFWGSGQGPLYSFSFWASAGWYWALVAGALGAMGLLLWLLGRPSAPRAVPSPGGSAP